MKQSSRFLVFLTIFTLSVGSAMAQKELSKGRVPEHTAFDNVSIGVEASTTGIGLSVATPLHRAFTLRGGFNVLPFSYHYTYDDFALLTVAGTEVAIPGLGLKASSRMYTGHLMVDWVPFRRGPPFSSFLPVFISEVADCSTLRDASILRSWLRQASPPIRSVTSAWMWAGRRSPRIATARPKREPSSTVSHQSPRPIS